MKSKTKQQIKTKSAFCFGVCQQENAAGGPSRPFPGCNTEQADTNELIRLFDRISDKGKREYAYTFIRLLLTDLCN